MGKRKALGHVYECDAPKCDVIRFEENKNYPVIGVTISLGIIDSGGGWGLSGWVCSSDHIQSAVVELLYQGPQ